MTNEQENRYNILTPGVERYLNWLFDFFSTSYYHCTHSVEIWKPRPPSITHCGKKQGVVAAHTYGAERQEDYEFKVSHGYRDEMNK